MNLDAIKSNIKWNTWVGDKYRKSVTWLGVKMLRTGRKLIKRGGARCSWCGGNPGFSSSVSRKGLRCNTLYRDCTDMPGENTE